MPIVSSKIARTILIQRGQLGIIDCVPQIQKDRNLGEDEQFEVLLREVDRVEDLDEISNDDRPGKVRISGE
jgi:hypothetical protein